jgi:phage terminase large subunit
MQLRIDLQPKQKELYRIIKDTDYSFIGYGGSNGGAKSHAIRDVNLILCLQNRKINTLIFRRLANDLLENHINPFFAKYPAMRKYFNKTEKIIYFPNGSLTKFGYADSEDDIYSFQGKEYDYIYIDEATHCTQEMIQFLRTRNRSKILKKAKMVCTMNPGGIGHAYIKRIFIDKDYQENENPADYYFLPAKIYDNVIWSLNALHQQNISVSEYYSWNDEKRRDFTYRHSDYAKALAALPEQLKLAYLEGDWDVFGGMFFKGFDIKSQAVEPFETDPNWKLIGSLDPGFSSPCSFGLTAEDYKGNLYRIYTYYEAGRNAQDHADAIWQLLNSKTSILYPILKGKKPNMIVAGHDAWAKKDRFSIIANELTFEDVFRAKGLYLTKAVTDRIPGWWAWKSYIPNRYFIFNRFNKPLIEQMSAVVSDKKDVEDIQGKGNDPAVEDHSLDEARYSIMSLFKPKERLIDTRPDWQKQLEKEQQAKLTAMSV